MTLFTEKDFSVLTLIRCVQDCYEKRLQIAHTYNSLSFPGIPALKTDLKAHWYSGAWQTDHGFYDNVRDPETGTPNYLLYANQVASEAPLAYEPLEGCTARVEESSLVITLDSTGEELSLDIQRAYGEYPGKFLQRINQLIAPSGVLCHSFIHDGTTPSEGVKLSNDSATVSVISAAWDYHYDQLVAAVLVSSSNQLIRAVLASLQTNSTKKTLRMVGNSVYANFCSAKAAYVKVSTKPPGVEVALLSILHPLAMNPADHIADHFYVVTPNEEELPSLFIDRLNLAIPWPVLPEWYEFIRLEAIERDAIRRLHSYGNFHGYRVSLKFDWYTLIHNGLLTREISTNGAS